MWGRLSSARDDADPTARFTWLLRPMSRLRINWSLTLAHKAREVAIASKPTVLHAKVSGYTTNFVRDVGGASVRLNMLHAPLPMGGWLVGVRATN